MAGFNKTAVFLLLVVACSLVISTTEAVFVPPCDQVCSRSEPEREECCRAHGHRGYANCNFGGMSCLPNF